MRSRVFIVVGIVLVILLGGAATLYAYDNSGGDTLARGITVGGIDIGGLTPEAARSKLEAQYVQAVERSIVIHHDTATWTLGAREAHIQTNVDAIIADAKARSAEGNIFSRNLRRLTDGTVDAALTPRVTFSDKAIIRTLDRVSKSVDRKAVDAKLNISLAGFKRVDSRIGLNVDRKTLHRQIKAAIVSPTAPRTFVAKTTHLKPKITTDQLTRENNTVLVVDKSTFTLKVYKNLRLSKTYQVAIGAPGHETPEGTFHIQDKQIDPVWSVPNSPWAGELAGTTVQGGTAANPLKARWLGVTDGVGFHGTSDDSSIGTAASHGCMRMHVADVIDLYPRVPVGATVLISH